MAGLRARRRPRIPSRSKGGAVEPKGGANAGWCHGHGWVSLKRGGCRGRHRTELHWGAWCLKPYPGKPDVRNFRGGAGNVTCGARASALPDRNASERRRSLLNDRKYPDAPPARATEISDVAVYPLTSCRPIRGTSGDNSTHLCGSEAVKFQVVSRPRFFTGKFSQNQRKPARRISRTREGALIHQI